jgi:hypothetical protein
MKKTNLRKSILASLAVLGMTALGLCGIVQKINHSDLTIEPIAFAQDQAQIEEQANQLNKGRPITAQEQGIAESVSGNCFAVVKASGVLSRGNCLISTARLATGTYEVIFNGNARQCTYLATIGLTGSSGPPPPGEIGVVGRATDVRGVFLQTRASNGALADRPFHLGVFCP